MKAQPTISTWFVNRNQLQEGRSYWIHSVENNAHYLGHYLGRGRWAWVQQPDGRWTGGYEPPVRGRRQPLGGEPPQGTPKSHYRLVDAGAFYPFR